MIIDNKLLHEACFNAMIDSYSLSLLYGTMYELNYNLGLRWIEAYEMSRWTRLSEFNWNLDTAKNSADRIIDESKIPPLYLQMLIDETQFYDYCRYSSYSRSFHRLLPWYPVLYGNKDVTTHIFRYNLFKQMNDDGVPLHEIASYFGEKDENNVKGYIEAELTTP
jgi:hypothetical protein